MDPSLTRTKAHLLFGELYSKSRPADVQEKIDRAIEGISDIYVRIQKIQEIDEQFRNVDKPDNSPIARSKSNGGGKKRSNSTPALKPNSSSGPGLLSFLFGKGDITAWGKKTGTIVTGLFGFNQSLSSQVPRSFNAIPDQQIVELLKAMRYFIARGWESFAPAQYNSIVTAYQFFEEYLKADLLFRKREPNSTLLTQTIKMQVLYSQLLKFENFGNFFQNELVEYLRGEEDFGDVSADLESGIESFLGFESRRPRLTDCLLAFYVIDRKKLFSWNDLVSELKVGLPVTDRYRAPDKVQKTIQQRIEKLQNEIRFRKDAMQEISFIRENYFKIDERGKANVDFLQNVVKDVLSRTSSEHRISPEYLKATISEPHRLLSTLLKDIDLNFVQLLSSAVNVQKEDGAGQVVIFKPTVFKAELDLLNEVQLDMNEFLKRFRNIQFSFSMYIAATKGDKTDQPSQVFLPITKKSCRLFSAIQSKIRSVITAHRKTEEIEKAGHLKEAMQRTHSLAIEAVNDEERFIPWADALVLDSGRFNQKSVIDVLDDMVRSLYNYLFVYRDPGLLDALNSTPRLKSELGLLEKKLLHYGPREKE
ncbi:MAG: hypothetical protein H3C43_08570 [Leptonema sp. (in: Bacteria)]|nr:hypothetical protein [Leptonema sp. (in: bacteria)]